MNPQMADARKQQEQQVSEYQNEDSLEKTTARASQSTYVYTSQTRSFQLLPRQAPSFDEFSSESLSRLSMHSTS
jgi:hypothetical protein